MKKTNIVKLSSLYKASIYSNKNDSESMQKAILATLYNSTSADKNPNHHYCPNGSQSWCFYNKAEVLGEKSGKHADKITTSIKEEFFDKLLPTDNLQPIVIN